MWTHARAPLDMPDIGQTRGPVGRGSLISKTVNWFVQFPPLVVPSAFLPSFRAARVGSPCARLDPKRGGHRGTGRDGSGGYFFDSGSSRSVPIGHTTLVIVIHDFSRRSVVSRKVRLLWILLGLRRVTFVTVTCALS